MCVYRIKNCITYDDDDNQNNTGHGGKTASCATHKGNINV